MNFKSFLSESLEKQPEPGKDLWNPTRNSGKDDMQLILRGLEIRPETKQGSTFWDDFLNVIVNNGDLSADFFEVSHDLISRWSNKIRKSLDKASKIRDEKTTMMTTGQSS